MVFCKKCGDSFKLEFKIHDSQKNECIVTSFFKEKVEEINKDDYYLILGKLAIKYKFISKEQLQQAISIKEQRKRDGQNLFLGEIMVFLGMMSQTQLDFLLLIQKMLEKKKLYVRFGRIAVKNAFVTQEEIDWAFKEQMKILKETKTVKLMEDILVEFGVLSEEQRDMINSRMPKPNPMNMYQ